MADETTTRALRDAQRLRAAIPLVAGAFIGLLLRSTLQFDPANSLWLLFESWITAVPTVEAWLRSQVLGQLWASWVSASLLVMLAFGGFARTGAGKRILKRIVKDPPWFTFSCLGAEKRRTMLNLELEPLPFVGRHDLLSEFDKLEHRGASFTWRMVVGPTGIGKTRLGIEWLEEMRKRRWDVGVVRFADLHKLRDWRSRKPTALLVDDARRWWDNKLGELLTCLADGSGVGRPVIVLVTDQSSLAIEMGLAEQRERLMALHRGEPARVPLFSEEEMIAFQESSGCAASEILASAAAGRPRAALIILRSPGCESYSSALHLWVRQILPALMDDRAPFPLAIAGPLLLSSLAGPIPMAKVRGACGNIDVIPLARFFSEVDASSLQEILPLLEPDDLALAISLQILPRLDGDRRSALVAQALSYNISTVQDRLAALSEWQGDSWTGGVPDSEEIRWLRWLQECFDDFAPDRVEAVRSEARELLRNIRNASSVEKQMSAVERLCDLARSRPFDAEIRSNECDGLSVAMRLCGKRKQLDALEKWGERLLRLLSLRSKLKSSLLNRSVIGGIMAAADEYAIARRNKDFDRWRGHLNALAESLSDTERRELRGELAGAYANILHVLGLNRRLKDMEQTGARICNLAEEEPRDLEGTSAAALACTHALCVYGQLGRVKDMKRWLAELFKLAGDSLFEPEPKIRSLEAEGIADAMGHFGQLRLFSELEVHGERLVRLVADERFSNDLDCRLREAEGASIAMKYYGESSDYESLERWGQILNGIARDARFEGGHDIRRRQLHGAVSATWAYGRAERHQEMLRWAEVGLSVSTDPRFTNSAVVQELASVLAVNATNLIGKALLFDEMEKWGKEVVRLAEIPEFFENYQIQEAVAQAIGNIIGRWARGDGDALTFAKWWKFLAFHAQHYPSHRGVQTVASTFGLSATEQLLNHFPYGRVQRRSLVTAPRSESSRGGPEIHVERF